MHLEKETTNLCPVTKIIKSYQASSQKWGEVKGHKFIYTYINMYSLKDKVLI